ncbi:hypothetical protein DICVIV_00156 [Dictyocaulus viviparus]|uniref:Uncharacterized protein n=1 Tax=Dictyocaulus viviparus TaxID=29172 RepID=A0A0D8YC12_DICVI|nr:hypothetical protein DICVIV_00156 [Dictyocaulus viviparus]
MSDFEAKITSNIREVIVRDTSFARAFITHKPSANLFLYSYDDIEIPAPQNFDKCSYERNPLDIFCIESRILIGLILYAEILKELAMGTHG